MTLVELSPSLLEYARYQDAYIGLAGELERNGFSVRFRRQGPDRRESSADLLIRLRDSRTVSDDLKVVLRLVRDRLGAADRCHACRGVIDAAGGSLLRFLYGEPPARPGGRDLA
jgi:hypothetical protein